jgi:NTE family protein
VQKGEPVIFDNNNMDIDVESIAACVGYPFYGIQWTRKDSHYLWDGSLLTNTPMLEAIKRSPEHRKSFYIVDVFPRIQNELPSNMIEVWHRARDIIFMDKTDTNIEMLKIRERYLTTLKKMHSIINSKEAKVDEKTRKRLNELESEYNELVQSHGAVIDKVTRISRTESVLHFLLEDTDFSYHRVKKLIREGEEDAENAIAAKKKEGTIEK